MANLSVRVTAQIKEQMVAAATAGGLTLQRFVVETLCSAIKKSGTRSVQSGALEFVLGLLADIERRGGTAEDGRRGYRRVGFEVGRQCSQLHREMVRPKKEMVRLRDLLTMRDPDSSRTGKQLLDWCDKSLEGIMEKVPSRRRAQFVAGFLEAVEGGDASWLD